MVRGAFPLHVADRELVALGARLGMETVAVELVGAHGLAPRAVTEAGACGLHRALRVVDAALAVADAPATGLVVERVLRRIAADLVCFSAAADPEGLADVPAAVALRLGTAYVPGVFALTGPDFRTVPAVGGGVPHLTALARRGDLIVSLEIPPGAIVDVEVDPDPTAAGHMGPRADPGPVHIAAEPPARVATAIRVMALADLDLDPTLVRRRNDLRGVVETVGRPLVSTTSLASLAALLV